MANAACGTILVIIREKLVSHTLISLYPSKKEITFKIVEVIRGINPRTIFPAVKRVRVVVGDEAGSDEIYSNGNILC